MPANPYAGGQSQEYSWYWLVSQLAEVVSLPFSKIPHFKGLRLRVIEEDVQCPFLAHTHSHTCIPSPQTHTHAHAHIHMHTQMKSK